MNISQEQAVRIFYIVYGNEHEDDANIADHPRLIHDTVIHALSKCKETNRDIFLLRHCPELFGLDKAPTYMQLANQYNIGSVTTARNRTETVRYKILRDICRIKRYLLLSEPKPTDLNHIANLNLSTRSLNCLLRDNIITVDQLIELSPDDLFNMRNMGSASIQEIIDACNKNGTPLINNDRRFKITNQKTVPVKTVDFICDNTVMNDERENPTEEFNDNDMFNRMRKLHNAANQEAYSTLGFAIVSMDNEYKIALYMQIDYILESIREILPASPEDKFDLLLNAACIDRLVKRTIIALEKVSDDYQNADLAVTTCEQNPDAILAIFITVDNCTDAEILELSRKMQNLMNRIWIGFLLNNNINIL